MKYRGSYEFSKRWDEQRQKSRGGGPEGGLRWRCRMVKEQLCGEREETNEARGPFSPEGESIIARVRLRAAGVNTVLQQ